MNKWTIIYCYFNQPIHEQYLKDSNPDADIILADISNNLPKKYAWRNTDKLVRQWLQKNIDKIHTNNIAIVEWDVLITKKLPDLNLDGIYCKYIHQIHKNPKWCWFREKKHLEHLEPFACGIVPFGFFMLSLDLVKIWIDKNFDFLYEKNIFCELRTGSIFRYNSVEMYQYPLPNILGGAKPQPKITNPDFYHPVKQKI